MLLLSKLSLYPTQPPKCPALKHIHQNTVYFKENEIQVMEPTALLFSAADVARICR
jgi:hypothetical protein